MIYDICTVYVAMTMLCLVISFSWTICEMNVLFQLSFSQTSVSLWGRYHESSGRRARGQGELFFFQQLWQWFWIIQLCKARVSGQDKRQTGQEQSKGQSQKKSKTDPSSAALKSEKSKQKESEKEVCRITSVISTQEKVLQLLTELNPSSVWKSSIRTVELERRLSKANVAIEELQSVQGNPHLSEDAAGKLSSVLENLKNISEVYGSLKALCLLIRQSDPETLSKDVLEGGQIAQQVSRCSEALLGDTTTFGDMVHQICKKLCEVTSPEFGIQLSN